jgi:hypothetical protein
VICCNSSWHYCSVVDFTRGDTRIPWKEYAVIQLGIIVLSSISHGVVREFLGGDIL